MVFFPTSSFFPTNNALLISLRLSFHFACHRWWLGSSFLQLLFPAYSNRNLEEGAREARLALTKEEEGEKKRKEKESLSMHFRYCSIPERRNPTGQLIIFLWNMA